MARRVWVRDPDAGGVKVPEAVKGRTRERIARYAARHYEGKYIKLDVRFRGKFGYVDAYQDLDRKVLPAPGESRKEAIERLHNTPLHLCRLRYYGNEDAWSMGFFRYSNEKYELCMFPSGEFYGTPEEAFETAASVYLGDGG